MAAVLTCSSCEQKYNTTDSCAGNNKPYKIGGVDYEPIPFKNFNKNARCPECGVKVGGNHHYECSEEVCPCCRGKVITCDCPYDLEPEEEMVQL